MARLNTLVRRTPAAIVAACALTLAVVGATTTRAQPAPTASSSFSAMVERLSESGGDFGGDNLISNEQSYLHVLPALRKAGTQGGAYVGVGPDQNFSYIAQVKPEIAYLVDLRRDNLLLLLLFKALFAESPTRVGYVCLLTGRPIPTKPESWADAPIEKIIAHIDGAAALPAAEQQKLRGRLDAVMKGFGVPLSAADLATIAKFHAQFVDDGLSLAFQVRGQSRRSYYPELRTLLKENDREGRQLSFLASESAFQTVRRLQAENRIVPIVGNVSGPHAMRAIAADMKSRGLKLGAFYISNVEYYLFYDHTFTAYTENVKQFPRDARSMVIRSVFPSGGNRTLAPPAPGHYSTSLSQSLDTMLADLAAGKYRAYRDLVLASVR